MKSLLRKKTLPDSNQKPSLLSSPSPSQQPSSIDTPLYSRFASVIPDAQAPDRNRPVVSGPMPLGRHGRINHEADDRQKKREDTRHKSSNGRQETPPIPQPPLKSFPGPREVQFSLDRSYQDMRVDTNQAARQPLRTQMTSSSDEQLATPNFHHAAATENTQKPLPSFPVLPQSSSYSEQVKPITLDPSSSSSFPSVVKPYVTAVEASALTTRLYEEPRHLTSRSSGKLRRKSASTSNTTKPNPTEQGPHKTSDRFLAVGVSRSPNQASHDNEQIQDTSGSALQGVTWTLQSNGRVDGTVLIKAPPVLQPNGQEKFGPKASQILARDPSLPAASVSPQDRVYRDFSQTPVTETTSAPSIDTPPQSLNKHANTTRRGSMPTRGQPRIFATQDPDPEPVPVPIRRGPLIFSAEEADSRHISHERKSFLEVGQQGSQLPSSLAKPLQGTIDRDNTPHDPQSMSHHSLSHPGPHKQEQVRTSQATVSYEDVAPPPAHPGVRRVSRGSAAKTRASQPLLEDRQMPSVDHSRKSSHGSRMRNLPSQPADPSTAPNLAPRREVSRSSRQADLDGDLPVMSALPVPERIPSPVSLRPPTPPEKSPPRDVRSESFGRIKRRSPDLHSPAQPGGIELVARPDMRKGRAVHVPAEPQPGKDDPSPYNVEDSQEDVPDAHLFNGFSTRQASDQPGSSIDEGPLHAPAAVGQLLDGSNDSVVNPEDSQEDDSVELVVSDSQHHQDATRESWEDDGDLLVSESSTGDMEPVGDAEPMRTTEPVVRRRPRSAPVPSSPEEYARARARRRGTWLEKSVPADIAELAEETMPTFYPLLRHLQNPELLTELLAYLSFYEWLVLWGGVSKEIRRAIDSDLALCDVALERYLGTVGYARWSWPSREPTRLTLAEMHAYMRGVSIPVHVYAQFAFSTLSSPSSEETVRLIRGMKKETRAFNRVVIRLRAQAEADMEHNAAPRRRQSIAPPQSQRQNNGPPLSWSAGAAQGQGGKHRSVSQQSSRAPSPTNSAWSHGASSQVHLPLGSTHTSGGFKSPLFRLRRAPLLRVFVPSPEGDWLSDASVVECETELRKAGILPLLRIGDVVWDIALGDEGNVGRFVWDGRYLIDLDYTFSHMGDLPPSLPALAFPPSYFHRVIRVAGDRNPIAHIDIRFWAEDIIANLQLLQDRVRTETPQGAYHTVVRWVHRSSFTILPPPGGAPVIMLPNRERRGVDPGWRGTVVIEAEGTNEGLADLHARCRGMYQPRAGDVAPPPGERERMVWRVLRERSRPGEIWIRAVSFKERLMP